MYFRKSWYHISQNSLPEYESTIYVLLLASDVDNQKKL